MKAESVLVSTERSRRPKEEQLPRDTRGQLIAMPVVPRNIQDEENHSLVCFQKPGHGIFCKIYELDLDNIVTADDP